MVSSDTVVGIVGAVILTGAMIAVFYYENSNADGDVAIGEGSNSYTFTYAQANATVEDQTQDTLANGESEDWTFDLPAYVFNVHATITWSETGETADLPLETGADQFTVQLLNETGGELDTATDRSGSIDVHHGHGPDDELTRPDRMTVQARGDSPDDARSQLIESTSEGAHGVGTWTVRVTLDDVGEGTNASDLDTGNDYTITITYSHWTPVAQE